LRTLCRYFVRSSRENACRLTSSPISVTASHWASHISPFPLRFKPMQASATARDSVRRRCPCGRSLPYATHACPVRASRGSRRRPAQLCQSRGVTG
jgi:hypothetical protein